MAHKAANPEKYPPAEATLKRYREYHLYLDLSFTCTSSNCILVLPANQRNKIKQYPPTMVHFQMFDDCCHVATTLSFSTPAKFQYRSCANFALWALRAAQVRVEKDHEKELQDISKDQIHFDFAIPNTGNGNAREIDEMPPHDASPPRYRFNPREDKVKRKSEDDTKDQKNDELSNDSHQVMMEDVETDEDEAGEQLRQFPLYKANGVVVKRDPRTGANVKFQAVDGEATPMARNTSNTSTERRRRRRSSIKEQLEKYSKEDLHSITQEDALEASRENEEDMSDYSEDSESEDDENSEYDHEEAEQIIRSRGNSSTSIDFKRGPNGHLVDATAHGEADHQNGIEDSQKEIQQELISVTGQEPPFKDNILRQRVTPDGYAREMEPEEQMTALQVDRETIGQISPVGPVWRWLEKKKVWDKKYRRDLIYYRKIRMKDRKKAEQVGHLSRTLFDENPPLSSVAGMYDENLAWQSVKDQDASIGANEGESERAGLSMLLWSKLSSKPDAEQQGRKTIDEMARRGNAKLKRRPSSIKTPDIEKEIEQML